MNYILVLIVALFLTIGWQTSVIAADDATSATASQDASGGDEKKGEEEPECD